MITKDLASGHVPLRDYIDIRFDALQIAIEKAERTMNTRLEGMNEFRETLKDQSARFVTRDELSAMLGPIGLDLRGVRDFMTSHEGKASQTSLYITTAIALVGLFTGVIALFVK